MLPVAPRIHSRARGHCMHPQIARNRPVARGRARTYSVGFPQGPRAVRIGKDTNAARQSRLRVVCRDRYDNSAKTIRAYLEFMTNFPTTPRVCPVIVASASI